ncbi:MAG: enoyl-CoA hydratase/isomerase family protein, partial [Alphaproteobacteria bacterium]
MDTFIRTDHAESASLAEALAAAGIDGADAEALSRGAPAPTGRFEADRESFAAYWRKSRAVLDRLPAKPRRDERAHRAAEALNGAARAARTAFLEAHVETIYRRLTADLGRYERLEKLVYDAAELVPGLTPSRADVARELQQLHAEKEGFEIDQGLFLARLMAHEPLGLHLCHAMLLPLPESAARLDEFARTGRVDLGKASVERRGAAAIVTMRNPGALNAEDGSTVGPLETAIDLALLDPASKICVLRGGPVEHPKFGGRRMFG